VRKVTAMPIKSGSDSMISFGLQATAPSYVSWRLIARSWGVPEEATAGNRLFKLTKNDRENTLNMFTFFGPPFEILNPLKIIYFNSDKM